MSAKPAALPFQKTETRERGLSLSYAKAERITVKYGFDVAFARRHNQQPYLSITCDIEQKRNNNRWTDVGGGAAHEHIVRLFPELKRLVAFHLCDSTGMPMHYKANALYFHALVTGARPLGKFDTPDNVRAALRATVCFGAVPGDGEVEHDLHTDPAALALRTSVEEFDAYLSARLPLIQAAFREACAKAGIQVP